MAKYHIWTVGCQMNKSDSERLASGLDQLGLAVTDRPEDADVVVLNTCVVRQSAEDTATGMLGTLRRGSTPRSERLLAVMGCMVGPRQDDLRRRFPHVDVWARPQEYAPILRAVGDRLGIDAEGCIGQLIPGAPAVATFVPVIHGCDKFCTFCIIPYRRGRQVSRPLDEVVHETALLAGRGVRDVTYLGQTVDAYGHDFESPRDLADLLYAVHGIDGIERIRFLTSHPSDMTTRIIDAVAGLPKVCENINLPFQAGDDAVLEAMHRGYTHADYLDLVSSIRSRVPGVAISTDLIVGFPGETDAQFERSLDMLREVRFDKVHAAAYSERPGTIASRKQPETVGRDEKKRRLAAVAALQERIQAEVNAALLGAELEVLVDGTTRGAPSGRSRTDKLVYLTGGNVDVGDTVRVRITGTSPYSIQGEVLAPATAGRRA
ncbi:MAG: tRNA (N6-isopentenyl adenosine(37)-C2)-methylthiotransferase MiaB [SAR202 cluster bacterium]|nr:tRNA (N6-isopentenyl adenosine(37)-C2)-methylthiotransferase MiaB [SAR202 cluster bacterium]